MKGRRWSICTIDFQNPFGASDLPRISNLHNRKLFRNQLWRGELYDWTFKKVTAASATRILSRENSINEVHHRQHDMKNKKPLQSWAKSSVEDWVLWRCGGMCTQCKLDVFPNYWPRHKDMRMGIHKIRNKWWNRKWAEVYEYKVGKQDEGLRRGIKPCNIGYSYTIHIWTN